MVMNRETIKALVLSGFVAVDSLDGPMNNRALLHDTAKIHFLRGSIYRSFCLVMILAVDLIAH